jgi:hypothetical protein
MSDERNDDDQQGTGQGQQPRGGFSGVPGGSRTCPNCGSYSYRAFFDAEGKAMCQCRDCDSVFPA